MLRFLNFKLKILVSKEFFFSVYGTMWGNGNFAQESFDDVCHSDLARCSVKRCSATLQREAIRLAQQRAFLREERFAARNEEMAIRAEEHYLETVVKRSDWWPTFLGSKTKMLA